MNKTAEEFERVSRIIATAVDAAGGWDRQGEVVIRCDGSLSSREIIKGVTHDRPPQPKP